MRIHSGISVIVAGALAVGGCAAGPVDSASEDGVSGTSPSPVTSQGATPAVALAWESVLELDAQNVTSVADTPVGTFVVASARRARPCDPTQMWSDAAGAGLAPIDVGEALGAGASVMQVVAGGPGAVAVGCLPQPSRLVVWTSADGRVWTLSETGYVLPTGWTNYALTSVAAGPDRAILMGTEFTSIEQFTEPIELAAKDAMPASLRPYAKTNILVEPQRASMNVGPFSAWSATLPELGLDSAIGEGYAAAVSGSVNPPVTITTDDYVMWTVRDEPLIPDVQASSIVATTDGFLASSWDLTGETSALFASADGETWTQVAFPVTPAWVDPPSASGKRAVFGSMSREEGVGLWESGDLGATWTELTPVPAGYWGSPAMGELGYLVATTVGDPASDPIEFSLERGRLVLTISVGMNGGSLRVVDGDRTIIEDQVTGHWRSVAAPSSVQFDNESGEVVVVDPKSGEAVMAIPYADVDAAFAKAVVASGVGTSTVAFSADGLAWSNDALPGEPDRFGGVGSLAVGDDAAWVVLNHGFGGSEVLRGTLPSAAKP